MPDKNKQKFYLVWGWIASLAAAVYMINDWKINGKDITIFDWAKRMWWSLDAKESHSRDWYVMRWIRVFEEKVYIWTYDLMSQIPSLKDPSKNIRQEFVEYNDKNRTYFRWRLMKNWEMINWKKFWLSFKHKFDLFTLILTKESKLDNKKIEDHFSKSFFETNFWIEFATIFGFQPWHSLIEFKRYLLRFFHAIKSMETLEIAEVTPYNQYESMVLPIISFLKNKWVDFVKNTEITNLDFEKDDWKKRVDCIHYKNDWKKWKIKVNENDKVFVTIGSMISNSSKGSMDEVPKLDLKDKDAAWKLWWKLAKKDSYFWNPKVFTWNVKDSKWTSYTITLKNSIFVELMKKFIDKSFTARWWVTLIDSNWLITVFLTFTPFFWDQPDDVIISWGNVLYPEKKWNFVKKRIYECTWKEILTEIVHHLKFEEHLDEILKTAICIPVMTPYVTSQFLPRKAWDRPQVIPENTKNFAFLWQFCEIPDDVVFTVEYSVRSAQIAVNSLLNLNKQPSPIYKWIYNPKEFFDVVKVMMK